MKNALILFVLLSSSSLLGQSIGFPANGCPLVEINTDPNNYSNPKDPNNERKWDWMADPNFTYYYMGNGSPGIPAVLINPFFDENAISTVQDYAEVPYKDFHPEDGWELLYKCFGSPVQGINTPPYFILYNKYTGKIRVFVNIVNVGNYPFTNCEISLSYDKHYGNTFVPLSGYQTAVLSHLGEHGFSPTQFQKYATHIAYNRPVLFAGTNDIMQWMAADFNTLFDPCTCGLESEFCLRVRLTTNTRLAGSYFGTYHTFVDTQYPQNATIELGGLVGTVQLYNAFGTGVIDGKSGMIYSLNQRYQEGDYVLHNSNKLVNATHSKGLGNNSSPNKISTGMEKILAVMPNLGGVFTLASSLITTVKKKGSNFDNLTQYDKAGQGFVGTIMSIPSVNLTLNEKPTLYSHKIINTLRVPGTKGSSAIVHTQPIYDNPLGVMNLLEQPEFIVSHYPVSDYQLFEAESTPVLIESIQLAKVPKVLLNPSSGLKIKDAEYSIVFENEQREQYTNGNPYNEMRVQNPFDLENTFKYYRPLNYRKDKWMENFPLLAGKAAYEPTITDRDQFYESIGLTILTKPDEQQANWNIDGLHNSIFQTNFLGQSCIAQKKVYSFSMIKNPTLKVKLILEPKISVSGSTVEEIVYILTFPGTVTNHYSSTSTNVAKINQFENYPQQVPFNITLPDMVNTSNLDELNTYKDVSFSNVTVPNSIKALKRITFHKNVSFKANTNYVIQSSGIIEINNTLNLPSSSTLKLIAGKEIVVDSSVTLPAGVQLIIDNSVVCQCEKKADVFPTKAEIAQLCNSSAYYKRISYLYSDENGTPETPNTNDEVTLYPNPASNSAFVTSALKIIDVELYDVSGKRVISQITQNDNTIYLNLEGVGGGLYLIKVTTANGVKTKQLIVE